MNKILIVDDDSALLHVLKDLLLLVFPDSSIYLASSGEEAIALCNEHNFDLISMDQKMETMTGTECLEKIYRPGGKNRFTPAIILTGYPMEVRETAEKFNCFVAQKPLSGDEYLSIAKLLAASRAA